MIKPYSRVFEDFIFYLCLPLFFFFLNLKYIFAIVMLLRCCPNARITLSAGNSLPVKTKDPLSPAASASSHGSNFNTSTSLLLGEMQGGSISPSTKSQADDTPVLHSLHPVLPHAMGQDGSLANVFIPLDAIKPSEFRLGKKKKKRLRFYCRCIHRLNTLV